LRQATRHFHRIDEETMAAATDEISILLELYDARFADLVAVLGDLPSEALAWTPFAQSPWQGGAASLGTLIAHALSATIFLVRRAQWAAGQLEWAQVTDDAVREGFDPATHDTAYLHARVLHTQEWLHSTLAGFDAPALEAARANERRPEQVHRARWNLMHALEHLSEHVGHANLTRQLWALQAA
jgi:hypothetical protein